MSARRWIAVAALAAACAGKGKSGGARASSCDLEAIGLHDVQSIPFYEPPAGCQAPPTPHDARIHSEDEFHAHYGCAGVASGIDFTRDQLVIEERSLSPAGGVGEMVGDAATITRVGYFRVPCEGDPLPMPIDVEAAYLLPVDDARGFADASCNIEVPCR